MWLGHGYDPNTGSQKNEHELYLVKDLSAMLRRFLHFWEQLQA